MGSFKDEFPPTDEKEMKVGGEQSKGESRGAEDGVQG